MRGGGGGGGACGGACADELPPSPGPIREAATTARGWLEEVVDAPFVDAPLDPLGFAPSFAPPPRAPRTPGRGNGAQPAGHGPLSRAGARAPARPGGAPGQLHATIRAGLARGQSEGAGAAPAPAAQSS